MNTPGDGIFAGVNTGNKTSKVQTTTKAGKVVSLTFTPNANNKLKVITANVPAVAIKVTHSDGTESSHVLTVPTGEYTPNNPLVLPVPSDGLGSGIESVEWTIDNRQGSLNVPAGEMTVQCQ